MEKAILYGYNSPVFPALDRKFAHKRAILNDPKEEVKYLKKGEELMLRLKIISQSQFDAKQMENENSEVLAKRALDLETLEGQIVIRMGDKISETKERILSQISSNNEKATCEWRKNSIYIRKKPTTANT